MGADSLMLVPTWYVTHISRHQSCGFGVELQRWQWFLWWTMYSHWLQAALSKSLCLVLVLLKGMACDDWVPLSKVTLCLGNESHEPADVVFARGTVWSIVRRSCLFGGGVKGLCF